MADYNRVLEINPENAEIYVVSGLIHIQLDNIEEAKFNLQKAQQLFNALGKIAYAEEITTIIQQYTGKEKLKTVDRNSVETSESNPQSAVEYYDRAFNYHQQQEYDLALADYDQAIELEPSNEKALINRGLIYHSQGEDESAIADYNKAIAINPNNSAAYRNRGVVYFQQREYKLAEADWDKAIKVYSSDALAYYNRGLLHQELDDYYSGKNRFKNG